MLPIIVATNSPTGMSRMVTPQGCNGVLFLHGVRSQYALERPCEQVSGKHARPRTSHILQCLLTKQPSVLCLVPHATPQV
jgi:hypothetical protein